MATHAAPSTPPHRAARERKLRLAAVALIAGLGLATATLGLRDATSDAAANEGRRAATPRVHAGPARIADAPSAPAQTRPSPPREQHNAPGEDPRAVAQRHEAQRLAERAAFGNDGWTFVSTTPPDTQLIALDPRRLDRDEPALRAQLESTALGDAHAHNARVIAERAASARTRRAAIAALGRADADTARAALRDYFDGSAAAREPELRAFAAAQIRPRQFGDDTTRWLAARVGDDSLPAAVRDPMALALVFAALAASEQDGQPPRERLLAGLPNAARPAVVAFFERVTSARSQPASAQAHAHPSHGGHTH